jgi:hypothetical protein
VNADEIQLNGNVLTDTVNGINLTELETTVETNDFRIGTNVEKLTEYIDTNDTPVGSVATNLTS